MPKWPQKPAFVLLNRWRIYSSNDRIYSVYGCCPIQFCTLSASLHFTHLLFWKCTKSLSKIGTCRYSTGLTSCRVVVSSSFFCDRKFAETPSKFLDLRQKCNPLVCLRGYWKWPGLHDLIISYAFLWLWEISKICAAWKVVEIVTFSQVEFSHTNPSICSTVWFAAGLDSDFIFNTFPRFHFALHAFTVCFTVNVNMQLSHSYIVMELHINHSIWSLNQWGKREQFKKFPRLYLNYMCKL